LYAKQVCKTPAFRDSIKHSFEEPNCGRAPESNDGGPGSIRAFVSGRASLAFNTANAHFLKKLKPTFCPVRQEEEKNMEDGSLETREKLVAMKARLRELKMNLFGSFENGIYLEAQEMSRAERVSYLTEWRNLAREIIELGPEAWPKIPEENIYYPRESIREIEDSKDSNVLTA
jgi:hypothetical protein